jgi:hypothetical protein
VDGDLFVGGGNITITSPVGRHLRVAGGNVTVNGPVRMDLLVASGTLALGAQARIGGDLIFGAGQTAIDGTVDGSVLGSAQTYANTGSVGGSQDVTLSEQRPKPRRSGAEVLLDQFVRYVGIVVIGALLLWRAPDFSRSVVSRLRERPLPSLGIGILGVAGFVAILIALFVAMAIVGIPLGILGFGRIALAIVLGVLLSSAALSYLLLLMFLFFAAIIVGLALGELAFGGFQQAPSGAPYPALLLGVFVIVALTAVPVLGGLINVVVVWFGLGALLLRLWSRPDTTTAVPAPIPGSHPVDPD